MCTYFSDFGQCKFTTYCRYKHEKRKVAFENFEKINNIEKKLQELLEADGERRNIDQKLKAFEKNVEEKMITFEKKIKLLNDVMEE